MILYLVHSTIVFSILFLLWMLLFRRQTHFQWQRFYLLMTGVISLIMPLIPVTYQIQLKSEFQLPLFTAGDEGTTITGNPPATLSLPVATYVSGVVLFGVIFLIKAWRVFRLIRNSEKDVEGIYKIKHAGNPEAFSVFNRIYMSDEIDGESRACIIKHERVHVRQRHSFDVLFFELLSVFFWFNPLCKLARRELSLTHEFIADEQACGDDVVRYKQILVAHMLGLARQDLIHSFSDPGNLKRRMNMITNPKSSSHSRWYYLAGLPVLAIILFLNALSFTSCKEENNAPATSAEFKGGTDAMMKYLSENIVYPDDAKEAEQQGTVYVSFTVAPDGKITNARVLKAVYPSLDNEALRVVNAMPEWKPGEENGEAVAAEMTLPIRFTLQ